MNPYSGQVYTEEEARALPEEVQKRLVRMPRHKKREHEKRAKAEKKRIYENVDVRDRRAKNKRAKASRKKNWR